MFSYVKSLFFKEFWWNFDILRVWGDSFEISTNLTWILRFWSFEKNLKFSKKNLFFVEKFEKKQKIWNFRISPKPCWHWWLILRGREEKSISVHASEWNETDAKMIAVSSVLEHRTIATVSSFISASDCMSCLQCWTYVKNNLDTSKSQWCCVCCYTGFTRRDWE